MVQICCAGWPELSSQLLATGMLATSCCMLAPVLHQCYKLQYVGNFPTCRLLTGALLQAEGEWSNELRHYQSDLQVRFSLQAGQVEAADMHPLTDQSDMLLMDRCVCLKPVAGFLATQRHVMATSVLQCAAMSKSFFAHDVRAITSVQVLCMKHAQMCMHSC